MEHHSVKEEKAWIGFERQWRMPVFLKTLQEQGFGCQVQLRHLMSPALSHTCHIFMPDNEKIYFTP